MAAINNVLYFIDCLDKIFEVIGFTSKCDLV